MAAASTVSPCHSYVVSMSNLRMYDTVMLDAGLKHLNFFRVILVNRTLQCIANIRTADTQSCRRLQWQKTIVHARTYAQTYGPKGAHSQRLPSLTKGVGKRSTRRNEDLRNDIFQSRVLSSPAFFLTTQNKKC